MEKSLYTLILASVLQCLLATSSDEKSLHFLAIGDFGGLPYKPYTTHTQKLIASEMGKVAKTTKAKFVIGLGDNFYYNGVKKVTDPRFEQTFESVYTNPSLKYPRCQWYMIAGNHDHHGNVSAQIAYTKVSKRWHFPHFYYTRIERIPNTNMKLQLVMIDTSLLLDQGKPKYSHPSGDDQMKWIKETLKNSTADYLIVAGHHPVISVGIHGPTKHTRMKRLQRLMERYNVTAYICGHDHNTQHLKHKKSNINYVITGNGNFVSPGQPHRHSIPKGTLRYFNGKTGGFTLGQVTPKKLKLALHTQDGFKRYTAYARPRRNLAEGQSMLEDFFKTQGQPAVT